MHTYARRRWTASALSFLVVAGAIMFPAAVVSANENRPPTAPVDLRVDDRIDHPNVEGPPRFGWLPQDPDAGEVQSAYQLQVRDAADETVWDSGEVASDEHQYVTYEGPELDRGSAYTWTVRTWDGDGEVSPWADAAAFSTGIADEDWAATWIQREPEPLSSMEVVNGWGRVTGGNITQLDHGDDWTDYVVEVTVRPHTGGAAVVFRSPDDRNGYMWQLFPGEGFRPYVHQNGSSDRLDEIETEIEAGQDYRLRIEIEGEQITTYLDGELIDEREDDTFTSGTIGFREASNEIGEFADVMVTDSDGEGLVEDDFSDGLDAWDHIYADRLDDEWTLARSETELSGDEVVRATAYTAAAHTYELWIDGQRADRGQSFGYSGENYYQATDVTDLVAGLDDVAVGAVLHWYGNGQGRPALEPGLLMQLEIEYADGTMQTIVTDGSWKTAPGPYVYEGNRNGEGERIEHLDATQVIDRWQELGFDDGDWDDAVELGAHPVEPFTALHGQETRMAETEVPAVELLTAADGTVVADFGVVIPGRPIVRFDDGEEGRTIEMRAGYGLEDDGRVDTSRQSTQTTDMSFPYTQIDGEQEFRAFTHLGFRYFEIPDAGEDIALEDVAATVVHTDTPEGYEADFASSDETLNAVWDMMQRSAIYSVQEAFVDTPTREKAQFLGDSISISYATMGLFGERDHTQQAIREFTWSADRYWSDEEERGRYNAVYPNGDGKRDIPDYTLRYVDWVLHYYDQSGDLDLVEEVYPYLVDTAGYVLRHIPDDGPTAGLVTDLTGGDGEYTHGIVDWPIPGRFDYDMDTAVRTTINAESVHVLRLVAQAGELLGRPDDEVAEFRDAAEDLVDVMNDRLRRADGIYVDGLKDDGAQSEVASQHPNSYAIGYRIAPEEDWEALADDVASRGMRQGPMTVYWLLRALSDADREDAVLDLLTNEDDLGWADILSQGGTFTWETWEPQEGSDHSESHGWSSQGAMVIVDTLLGVRSTAPGAAELALVPPEDVLDDAEGTVPTQRGPVTFGWQRGGDGLTGEVELPVNVTATLELPMVGDGSYEVVGGDATYVGTEDGRAVYEIGSGTTSFRPGPSGEVCDRHQGGASFPDAAGSGHRAFIDCLAELGLVEGFSDGTYRPGEDVSREQLASYVVRALELATGEPLPVNDGVSFPDVDGASTHGGSILKLASAGIIQGYGDGAFAPRDSVSRDQTARFVVNALEHVLDEPLEATGIQFADVVHGQYRLDIDKLATADVIQGFDDRTYGPREPVTRGQMARFLGNGLEVLASEGAYAGP